MIPPKLTVTTDNNELTFIQVLKAKDILYEYEFTKSVTKEGMRLTMTEKQLEENLRKIIFKKGIMKIN